MSAEVKKCPFCGGQVAMERDSGNEVCDQKFFIKCHACGIQMQRYGSNTWAVDSEKDNAARNTLRAAWNRRTTISLETAQKLADYANHLRHCDKIICGMNTKLKCNCGLSDALAAFNREKGGQG